jgi:RNA polymerase sigma-70 factor (ECF subfamily)
VESRVALTLRMAGGLDTRQIAKAFLISESTASQRLLRAKRKISHAGIAFRVPAEHRLAERTGGVLAVLYLIFNEGYGSPDGELTREALRLVRLLVELMPDEDEARALLALLLFLPARRARTGCRPPSPAGTPGPRAPRTPTGRASSPATTRCSSLRRPPSSR